tara:strand:+ start:185 stop:1042 length:858 start_codon:yes stop_codon:yes gene_type:complete
MADYYGDETRWFIGYVVNNVDPLKLDRVKVRIIGIHTENTEDIDDDDLPWAQVNVPVTEDGSSGQGANSQLKVRAQVFGIFLDGKNSQLPLILGSIPKVETNTNAIDESLPKVSVAIDGNTNIEKAFNFFISPEGGEFTPQQACGMIGNFCVESGAAANRGDLNPAAVSGFKDEGSFGIAQWNPAKKAGDRFGELVKFASRIGRDHREIETQLRFVKHELETIPYLGIGQLRRATTLKDATIIFQNKYERPNKDLAHTDQRIAYAQETMKKLGTGVNDDPINPEE